MRTLAATTVVLSLSLVGGVARAEPRDPAGAELLFEQGRSLVAAGRYAEACPKFAESLRLDHAPGALLNLADCEDHVGHTATAWALFRELANEVSDADERQALAAARAKKLERSLAHLTVKAPPFVDSGKRVVRDDVELGPASLGIALPIDPGRHTVFVVDGNRVLYRANVDVAAGQARVVGPESFEAEPATVVRTTGWVMAGLSAATLATSAGFAVGALLDNGAGGGASARGADGAHADAAVAGVALGIGVATAAAATCLLLLSRPHPARKPSPPVVGLGTLSW